MAISFESALNAYNAASRRFVQGPDENQNNGPQAPGIQGDVAPPTFGDLVRSGATQAVETMRQGERMSAAAVIGQADVTDVVMAVNNAEVTLQAVVSIRDRMISAYQEILRMPM
ncbi:MAG: flagellar hook-basal body complex protein FliE [Alphaproteobacteria bacterium]|nr:flagellar hook-basal body complex protein FliE [Alphaproteobacteria bacterium SS10]